MTFSAASGLLASVSWGTPALIFFARIADVSLGTIRLICVTRGRRAAAIVLGFFEILIWVFAVSKVLTQLDHWANILAYACGFAAGNALGMTIESRLAMGVQRVSLISRGRANAVAERLRFAGFPVTTFVGSGREGPVSMCMAVISRKLTPDAIRMAREIDADVVITVEDLRMSTASRGGTMGAGKSPLVLMQQLWEAPRAFVSRSSLGRAPDDSSAEGATAPRRRS